ncbi:MAG: glyoxalase family protein [Verrucomicrobiota bacterium]|jgi:phospholipase/carboxylesterase
MTNSEFIHRFVPAKEGRWTRTLLLLHGTGGNEDDMLGLGRSVDPNAALLSPRGKVSENGAPRFFRRLAEGVFDEEDVIARAHELADFIDSAATRYGIDMDQLVAVGYSNGANIAAAMSLLGVAKYRSAILFRAMVPLAKINGANLSGSRILMSSGESDPIATQPIAQRLAELFKIAGAEVTLTLQPSGHELRPGDIQTAQKWLSR